MNQDESVPHWIKSASEYLRSYLAHQLRITRIPGCSIAAAYQSVMVFQAAYGTANLRQGLALTTEHCFRVASHSKTFTAVGLLKLRESGAVRLDDPVGRYVSGLHPLTAARTIEQVISNGAGIAREGRTSEFWLGRQPFPDHAAIREELAQPPVLDGSSRFKYSNLGFSLAGLVIESITGQSYGRWISREVIEAAKLKSTQPDVDPDSPHRIACGHSDDVLLGRRVVYPGTQTTAAMAPATGFVSTAADLCRFYASLSPRATTSILTAESRRELVRPRWKDVFAPEDRSYALGMTITKIGGEDCFGHGGAFQGYLSQTSVLPSLDMAVSVLTNSSDGRAREWADAALAIFRRFASAAQAPSGSQDWTGRWWSIWGAVDLVPLGEKILVAPPALLESLKNVAELSIIGPDEALITESSGFFSLGERVKLHRGPSGSVDSIQIGSSRWIKEEALADELRQRYDN